MGSLVETIRDPAKRSAVLDDCVLLIDAEVASKRGFTGVAVKTAFKSVRSLRPGMIRQSMEALLDDFSAQVEPFWQDCQSGEEASRTYFQSKHFRSKR